MSIAHLAQDFSALLAAGETRRAADKYWAQDVEWIAPECSTCDVVAGDRLQGSGGFNTARRRLDRWLADNIVEDVMIDGPFITGNTFALFIDRMVTDRRSGQAAPFSEIAIYTVHEDKIIEERHFYEPAGTTA
ncbi:hypothetical protein GRI44_00650 [Altererythrobacter confluentis]|uniref:SnoaL-like domain-containing protein n=1 Tax=Allopontixanthobacter confluentis TaxID=1849021 RepID=A0A6L7GBK4_9SPHN|nr:SnoaL-like domain-containing protein [Allopontixanthobacter confluentis]MXP13267.1 hypothetical protein [Allopontixanthobacter confluentis]